MRKDHSERRARQIIGEGEEHYQNEAISAEEITQRRLDAFINCVGNR